MSYRTKKGAKIAFSIFATLCVINSVFLIIIGLNETTLMTWLIGFVLLINTGSCIGYYERIEELEVNKH